jgi:hypothetical protein
MVTTEHQLMESKWVESWICFTWSYLCAALLCLSPGTRTDCNWNLQLLLKFLWWNLISVAGFMKQSTYPDVVYSMVVLLKSVLRHSWLPWPIEACMSHMCPVFDFPDFSGWPRSLCFMYGGGLISMGGYLPHITCCWCLTGLVSWRARTVGRRV